MNFLTVHSSSIFVFVPALLLQLGRQEAREARVPDLWARGDEILPHPRDLDRFWRGDPVEESRITINDFLIVYAESEDL